ncbi:F-box protein CPR1-like [Rutidosis leptorrhynchoides]|uniref:F-box protein CPR1-like n=1 Tax=Rutidosis leptorrhynchoides TaxID=125765 RepID=UPI003A99B9C6
MVEQMIESSFDYLLPELIIDIFIRLPVKTLIRCTSVCKSWYTLIRNPNFVISHFNSFINRYKHHDNGYILFGSPNSCHLVFDTTFKLLSVIQTPFIVSPNHKSSLNFIGSCNGLLCLAPGLDYNLGNDVYIWNPLVNASKKLPPSQFSDEFTDDKWIVLRLGFGFHELSNDYKVIRLVYFTEGRSFTSVDVSPLVEIYSLKTNAWKIVCTEVPPIVTQSVVTSHKGVFYWMGFKSIRDDPLENYIMSFDLDDEKFREIEQPSVDFPFSLLAVRGSAESLFAIYSKFFGGQNDILVLWKLDLYSRSWTKAYTIQCYRGVWWTLGFTRSGKFLYANLERELVSFDLESLQTEVHHLEVAVSRSAVDVNYTESLLLFDH